MPPFFVANTAPRMADSAPELHRGDGEGRNDVWHKLKVTKKKKIPIDRNVDAAGYNLKDLLVKLCVARVNDVVGAHLLGDTQTMFVDVFRMMMMMRTT